MTQRQEKGNFSTKFKLLLSLPWMHIQWIYSIFEFLEAQLVAWLLGALGQCPPSSLYNFLS